MSDEIMKNRWVFDLEEQLFPKIKEIATEKFKGEYPGFSIVPDELEKDSLGEMEWQNNVEIADCLTRITNGMEKMNTNTVYAL